MKILKIGIALIISAYALIFSINIEVFILISLFLILLFVIPSALLNRKIMFFFILSPFFILPQLKRYDVIPILSWNITVPIIILLFVLILSKVRLDNSYNLLFIFFIFYMGIEIFRGWNYGYEMRYLFGETIKYIFYPLGFYFTYSIFNNENEDEKILKYLLLFFILMGMIISLQIIYYYFYVTFGDRVITRQANLLIISFISALAYILYFSEDIFNKILLGSSMILYLISLIIIMQRSLWIGFIISLFLFILLYQRKFIKSNFKKIVLVFLIFFILFGTYLIYESIVIDKSVLEERTDVIGKKGKTFSIGARILSYYHAFRLFLQNPILGKGMGDSIITPYLNQREIGIVDNSYLVVLWKMGIIGFLIFLFLYVKFLTQLIKIITKTKFKLHRLFGIIIISIIVGQMINGLACVIMTLYFFNIIWGVFIAITDYLYRKEFVLNE